MAEQTLKEKTAKGLFWGGISNGIQQILSLIFGIILARILNASDYGLVSMLAVFSAIASTIQESGFTAALVNQQDVQHKDYNAVFWFSSLVSILFYGILFFAAPLIARFYEKPELILLSRIVFLGFLFGGFGIASSAYLFKSLMVRERAKVDITSILLSGVVGVILALNGYTYIALAIQSVVYISLNSLLILYYAPWHPTFHLDFTPLKKMFGFSSKLFFTNIVTQIGNNIFSVILGKFYSAKQVGYYSQGNKWMTMGYGQIVRMISGVAQPVFIQLIHDEDRLIAALRKMFRFGAFISFPVLLGLAFVSKEFIIITIGEKWLPSVIFLQLFCIWGAFAYMISLYTNLLIAYGLSDIYFKGIVGTLIVQLIVLVIFYKMGIYIMLCSYIFVSLLSIYWWHTRVCKILNFQFILILKDVLPYLFVLLFSFMTAYAFCYNISNNYLLLILKIIISGILYLTILWLAGSKILKESVSFICKNE